MLKRIALALINKVFRWYFIGKQLYRLGDLDGQKAILNYGRIISYDRSKLTLHYLENGSSFKDARKVSIFLLKYDRHLKAWVFYD